MKATEGAFSSKAYYWESIDRILVISEFPMVSDVWAMHSEGNVYSVSREVFDAALEENEIVFLGDV